MTYCVGMVLDRGLVLMSDTRTNAGVDNISTFRKMFSWHKPGERILTLMTAGNLGTTQAVVSRLEERTKAPSDRNPSLFDVPSMFQAARLVANTLKSEISNHAASGPNAEAFGATLILGGQIKGIEPRLFLIYPEGNFVEASVDTPFFQIGETKYGRPILVRAYDSAMTFEDAVRLILVSFDSTIKANLSVAPPIDVGIIKRDDIDGTQTFRIEGDDPQFLEITEGWGDALKEALGSLRTFELPD